MDGTVIIEGRRRRTWPTEFKKRVVMESCDPDVSVSEVARRYELDPAQLFAWRKKYLPSPAPETAFLPIDIVPEQAPEKPSASSESIEVVLTNGRRLFVPATMEPNQLGRLARTLDR